MGQFQFQAIVISVPCPFNMHYNLVEHPARLKRTYFVDYIDCSAEQHKTYSWYSHNQKNSYWGTIF